MSGKRILGENFLLLFTDDLIKTIRADIAKAEKELDKEELKVYKGDKFFTEPIHSEAVL